MITVYQSSVELGDPHICSDSANQLGLIFSVYGALVRMDSAGRGGRATRTKRSMP
jgi:hypothetical protein